MKLRKLCPARFTFLISRLTASVGPLEQPSVACQARISASHALTVRAWEGEILAWHATKGCSNGPTEAVNLLIKKVKRVGHGFRNFDNYRLRLLLHCGVRWQTSQTARLRGRAPQLVA